MQKAQEKKIQELQKANEDMVFTPAYNDKFNQTIDSG